MGSEKKNLDNDHAHQPSHHTPPKLSLLVSRTIPPQEAPTPPPRTTVSIPFQWEEVPGKPRPCHTGSDPKGNGVARALDLPPRLLFLETKVSNNTMPSPTTVLDGPYVGRAVSFASSYRASKDTWNANFGSGRWSGLKKNREDPEGNFEFSSWREDGTGKVKITRDRRRGSFLNLSRGKSQLWASIYENFKQVVPWKRKQEKLRKWAPKIDTV